MIRISAAAGKEGRDWFIDLAEQARAVANSTIGISMRKKSMIVKEVEAKMLQDPQPLMLSGVPSGNLMHRSWRHPRLDMLRRSKAEDEMVQMSKVVEQQLEGNHLEWTRALVSMMALGQEGELRNKQQDRDLRIDPAAGGWQSQRAGLH